MRKRGELIERSFAHCYDTGGMRRTHLRGHENILKRLLVHVAGFNLSLVMRRVMGFGTPRGLQGLSASLPVRWIRRALGSIQIAITALTRRNSRHYRIELRLAA